jgi:hypothetical protein
MCVPPKKLAFSTGGSMNYFQSATHGHRATQDVWSESEDSIWVCNALSLSPHPSPQPHSPTSLLCSVYSRTNGSALPLLTPAHPGRTHWVYLFAVCTS